MNVSLMWCWPRAAGRIGGGAANSEVHTAVNRAFAVEEILSRPV